MSDGIAVAVPQPGGFSQPPALPAVPNAPSGGNPIVLPGQTPGMQQNVPVVPAVAVTPTPAAQTQDLSSVVALLQAALQEAGVKPNTDLPAGEQVADALRPAWMKDSANSYDVDAIDDPVIKSMATVLQSAGKDLDLDRVLGRALQYGDVALIDTAYLKEKGGANADSLLRISQSIVQAVEAKSNAVTQSVYALVGGEAQWSQATAVFNQSAPQEVRVTVAQMLNSTNEKFIQAGAKIIAEFGRNSGQLIQLGAPLLNGLQSANMQGQGLSRDEFKSEVGKLDKHAEDYNKKYEALHAQRKLGMSVGK